MVLSFEQVALALASNEELETRYGDGDEGNFLSGWQCENPGASEFRRILEGMSANSDVLKYYYFEEDAEVRQSIRSFHRTQDGADGADYFPSSCGSSSIIFAFCAYLKTIGIGEIFYIPPIYFSMHYALQLLGIKARPITAFQAYERQFSLTLPRRSAPLLFVDPLWLSGRHVPRWAIDEIAEWQQATGSIVFVDGSFQYMMWNGINAEPTASLDPERTFRLICPTKIMALHGFRFSCLCFPRTCRVSFTHVYTNIYASSSAFSKLFALAAMAEMMRGHITRGIIDIARQRYVALEARGIIESEVEPDSGYFTFCKINRELPENYKLMTQEFFEQKRYPHYAKVNLVSPSFNLLGRYL